MKTENYNVLIPFFIFYTALTIFVSANPFFWDCVQLGSLHGHWYYEHNFTYLFLPEEMDSGHPPIFGMYIALLWKLFGRSLLISHLAVLPFLLGIVVQLYRLLQKFLEEKFVVLGMLIILADPTLLAQSTQISPDIILIFFLLLSLNYLLSKKYFFASLALCGLAIISLRGMMHVAALFFIALIAHRLNERKFSVSEFIRISMVFVPAALLGTGWLAIHYQETGWLGYHENSPWRGSFQSVSFMGFVRNIGIMFWRFIDFGRILCWIIALPVFVYSIRNKLIDRKSILLGSLFVVPLIVMGPNLLLHSNLLGHRYLIIFYLSFSLLIMYQIGKLWPTYFKKLSVLILAGLITGNLWVYNDTVAQGWDSTLSHYPYYKFREETIAFIKSQKIDPSTVGTGFPNKASVKHIDLSEENWKFADKNLDSNTYVLYSNVYNDFSDGELKELKKWDILIEHHSMTVKMILYENPRRKSISKRIM